MSDDDKQQEQRNGCCIPHEFYAAATANPTKIVVIHAAAVSPSQLINHNPPTYVGDHCFTFVDVSRFVDSLSYLLRSILAAGVLHVSKSSTSSVESPAESENVYSPKIIGIYIPPSVEYIVSVLSVLRCGEAFLPLDPSWPDDRVVSIVSAANLTLVITNGCCPVDNKTHWLGERTGYPVLYVSVENMSETPTSSSVWPCENKRHRSFCYLMYTSGSTGRPKGVCGIEQGLLNRFWWMQELYPFYDDEHLLFKTAVSFIDHMQEFLGAILAACTLVIPPFKVLKENMFSIVNFLEAYSISRLTAVPSLIKAILPALQSGHNKRISDSLKLLVLSGEVLPLSLWDILSNLLPKTSILNLYRSTEVSGDCTFFDGKRLPMILERENLTSVPIGVPIANCNVILVGDSDSPTEGEIHVGGTCLFNGYFLESDSDFVSLHQNTICSCSVNEYGSQLCFKTGDFAQRLQSGDLIFVGRKDRNIKLNGQRIALEEIETVLRGHPDVDSVAVNARTIQGQVAFLEALLVMKDTNISSKILSSSIRSWMANRVTFGMIPTRFHLIESLPNTYSGKVDYSLLEGLTFAKAQEEEEINHSKSSELLQLIKKAFPSLYKFHLFFGFSRAIQSIVNFHIPDHSPYLELINAMQTGGVSKYG